MLRIAIFPLLLALPLRANLGETVSQCVVRYGHPNGYAEANSKLPFGTIVFRAGGYDLIVFLANNVEVGARVTKTDKSDFSPDDLQNILRADSAPGAWTSATSNDPNALNWIRPDNATATYDKKVHMLIFTTPQMAAALKGT